METRSKQYKHISDCVDKFGDVWEYICLFLDLEDINNLKLCSKTIQKRLRVLFSKRFRVKLNEDVLNDPLFREIVNHVGVVKIRSLDVLKEFLSLKERGLVYDIKFEASFNQSVDGILPPTLTHLDFGPWFNQSVDGILPPALTHLYFGHWFNQSVDEILPPNLTHLYFGSNFNQIVKRLPPNLTHLSFGGRFNQSVDGILPPTLTHLCFGYGFNQSLEKLPPTLTHLTIPIRYSLPVPSWIPNVFRE
jgi:hypothetical protein